MKRRSQSLCAGLALFAVGWFMYRSTSDPSPSPIASDERIVFFDTHARRSADGAGWIVPIHGWIHEPERSRVRKKALEEFLDLKYDLEVTDANRAYFDRRVDLFLVDNERGKRVAVQVAGEKHVLPPSAPNGHFEAEVTIAAAAVERHARDGRLEVSAVLPAGDARRFAGSVHLVEPEGLSVISDIDDTVKITNVTDHRKMFAATFLEEFRPAPGMVELYRALEERGASFHFVSSSPWHLYEPLREFTTRVELPPATFHLKLVRFRDRSIANVFKKGTETKPLQIEPILAAYPKRRFILVGDSGEQDPEVYAALLRKHGDRIERVLIRNVTGASRDDDRFRRVFDGIDASRWELFDDPASVELPARAAPR